MENTVNLFAGDYVFLNKNNEMVTWIDSDEIFITSDEREVKEELENLNGYKVIDCLSLNQAMQQYLKNNILQSKYGIYKQI